MLHDTDFALCARLVRSLTHLIRGDLSVITNDLTYLGSLVEPQEVVRAQARCSRVATTLSKLSLLLGSENKVRRSPSEVQQLFGECASNPLCDYGSVVVDLSLIRRAISLLSEIVGGWERVECRLDEACVLVQTVQDVSTAPMQRFRSGSEYAAAKLGEGAVVEGCLIDLIFRDHGWILGIFVSPVGISTEIRIPLLEATCG
jgi:hypothetical protein